MLNPTIKEYILRFKDQLINDTKDSWEDIYHQLYLKADSPVDAMYISQFTRVMYQSGIDPLLRLNYVPAYYLYEAIFEKLPEFTLHSHLEFIDTQAFSGCGFDKLILPKELLQIRNNAFETCDIKELIINEKLLNINISAFEDADIKYIMFPKDCKLSLDFIAMVDSVKEIDFPYNDAKFVKDKIAKVEEIYPGKFWANVYSVKCKDGYIKQEF